MIPDDPTPGALRAAIAILEDPDLGEDPMADARKIAKIIDREARIPELLTTLICVERGLNDIEEICRRITKDTGTANLAREKADWCRTALANQKKIPGTARGAVQIDRDQELTNMRESLATITHFLTAWAEHHETRARGLPDHEVTEDRTIAANYRHLINIAGKTK